MGFHDCRQNHQAFDKLETLSQEQGAPLPYLPLAPLLCESAEKSVPGAPTPRLSPGANPPITSR